MDTNTDLSDVKSNKAATGDSKSSTASTGQSTNAKGSTATSTNSNAATKVLSAFSVKAAASHFASDANTVSASLNALPPTTDSKTIKSLAFKAFVAEFDEDAQRAVLAAAAGSSGSASNSKIVKNTPGSPKWAAESHNK
jgi:hypothetical protein